MTARIGFVSGVLAGLACGAVFGVWHGRRTAPARVVEIVKAPAAASVHPVPDTPARPADGAPKEVKAPGGLALGRNEETPPPTPGRKAVEIASVREALTLLPSMDSEEREAAIDWLRERLYTATAEEWAELDPLLAAALAGIPAELRAEILDGLFGSSGFLLERQGPILRDGRLRELFFSTARDAPAGAPRRKMLRALYGQMMGERKTDLAAIFSTLDVKPELELGCLESAGGPSISPAGAAVLLEEMGRPERLGLPLEDTEDLLGLVLFSSPSASDAEHALLARWATDHVDPKARAGALLLLGSVGTPEASTLLTGIASNATKPVSDRVMAYLGLRKAGREGMLPEATRREILKLWKESGVEKAEGFISK